MKLLPTGIRILAAILIAVALESPAAVRPTTNAVTISAGLERGFPGSTVWVPISFTHTGVVSAIQFDLDSSTARMTASAMTGGAVSNGTVLRSRQIAPGRHRVLVYSRNLSLVETNLGAGSIPFAIAPGDLAGGGPVRVVNPLAATSMGDAVNSIRLLSGGVLVGPVARDADGVVDLFLTVQSNRTYVIQATTNFFAWETLSTNTAVLDYVLFKDLEAGDFPRRFYRAVPIELAGQASVERAGLGADGFLALAISFPAAAGRTYVVQTTTNLVEWQAWSTQQSTAAFLSFTNTVDPATPRRFYRLMEQR